MNVVQETEEDDTFDDEYAPAPIFKRGVSNTGSFMGRMSTMVRRSLRLPSRQTLSSPTQEVEDTLWADELLKIIANEKDSDRKRFTENSNTFIGPSSIPSRLREIKENRRLNRTEKVKKIVRKADWPIRHEIRKELWRELCKGKDYDSSKSVFRGQIEDLLRSGKKNHSPQFLNEDGVVVNNFDLNEQGTMKLLRLLKVIENLRPEISSAPILYPLCALMLHYMEEEDVFACVQHLLVTKGYLMTSPVEWVASAHTILALVKKHKTDAYKMLKRKCNCNDDTVLVQTIRDWLSWIFHGLPFSHVARIVDCFLVEGQKFVTRAGIAIVYIWAKGQKYRYEDLSGKSLDERIEAVRNELMSTAQQMQVSTDTFINTCIRINNLKSATIARLQGLYEAEMRDEVNRTQSQKKSARGRRSSRHLFTQPFESKIIDADAANEIMAYLPPRLQLVTPVLLFRLSSDGASFTHMWSRIDEADQTLIIIRSTKNDVFGAYCSSSWAERNDRRERTKSKYFGTGESFVFRLDKEIEMPVIYGWVGNNNDQPDSCPQMFMAARERLLVIGSGDGDAIRIDEELTHGISSASKTFDSPALVVDRTFDIHELEVFGVLTGS